MITVEELVEELLTFNPNMKVFIASDEEWNSIHPLGGIGSVFTPDPNKSIVQAFNREDLEDREELLDALGFDIDDEDIPEGVVLENILVMCP